MIQSSKIQRGCLDATRLRQLLSYDPETGEFLWRVGGRGNRKGAVAGDVAVIGYHRICVERQRYWSHRLAWLYMTGEWPTHCIDHIDGEKLNNRFANLREATISQNLGNRPSQKNNSSGFKGVSWAPNAKRWRACLQARGTRHHLGYFDTPEEAHQAYVAGARKHHGEFAHA